MKQYIVINRETGYHEEFFKLSLAKKAMKKHNAVGMIYKTWRYGYWECLGEIKLNSNNKTFVANTRQTTKSYN